MGTGLGSAMIVDSIVEPMELGHLPYLDATFEDYVGVRGFKRYGELKWRTYVADVVARFIQALEPDEVVLGGGNVHNLGTLPVGCRMGNNDNAFVGGFRLWNTRHGNTSYVKDSPAPNIVLSCMESPAITL
jgi:polyphosphate glucokinase